MSTESSQVAAPPPAVELKGVGKDYCLWPRASTRLRALVQEPLFKALGLRKTPLSERYRFTALKPLDLRLERGRCLGIIGANGSGKSTLLQLICGILQPSCGSVHVPGKIGALLELGSGFHEDFTGRDNVVLNAALHGLTTAQTRRLLPDILDFAEIGDFIDQPVKTYSSGMRLRLAFSVLAHLEPDLLLIDEALAVGDARFVQKCMRWLETFREAHTLILVSHQMAAITALCDTVAWLDRGQLRYLGEPRQAVEAYLEAQYAEAAAPQAAPTAAPQQDHREDTPAARAPATFSDRPSVDVRDERHAALNRSQLRNDLPVFPWARQSAAFGRGHVRITEVVLREAGHPERRHSVQGGELVEVVIVIEAQRTVSGPIIGFGLKNRWGQELFHDNTYLSSYLRERQPMRLARGERARSLFAFVMPYLPPGDYFLFAAVATGTHARHTQEHWVHEALKLTSTSDRICLGLIGLPMQRVHFAKLSALKPALAQNAL